MNRELTEQAAKSVVFENNGEKTDYQNIIFINYDCFGLR